MQSHYSVYILVDIVVYTPANRYGTYPTNNKHVSYSPPGLETWVGQRFFIILVRTTTVLNTVLKKASLDSPVDLLVRGGFTLPRFRIRTTRRGCNEMYRLILLYR